MIVKLVSFITAVVLGVPISGVYASADSPSKYLDRLTTSNSSSEAMGGEAPRTTAKAVNVGHGIVLNTVDKNADRLEYVNLGAADGGNDSDAESSPYSIKVSSEDNPSRNTPPNDASTQSIEWPGDGFTGETTITYDANGKGSFADGATTNAVTTKYDGFKDVTKYAHTDNVDDAGVQHGGYGDNKSYSRVVTIPGASRLTVDITYQTESTSYDWVCAYTGGTESSPAGDAQCSTAGSLTGKLGGKTNTTRSFTVDGDSVTFWFRSDSSGSNYYGYYAVVKGFVGSKQNVSGEYTVPVDPSGEYKFASWNTKADGTGENLGAGEVYSPSNQTVYAQWKLNYTKWNTVGWRITDDGTLKLRPWEGDTGTTGSLINYNDAPWYNQASKIKKVESTGNIVLNANSVVLFYNCSNLTDITALASWDVSNVMYISWMFKYCSKLTDISALASWNVFNVTDMNSIFDGCSSLTDLSPLASWNVSKVSKMYSMFRGCSSLTDITALESWDVSKVTDMNNMFSSCSSLTDLTGLARWNVFNVTSMYSMFDGCSSLTDLTPITDWNVSNVTNMSFMFRGCSSLIDISHLASWNISNVRAMGSMFSNCRKLTDLTALTSWNVSNVTNMIEIFSGCSNLTDLTPLASWDVSNVTSMYSMFSNCSSLTDLTALASWDVSKVTSMKQMFSGCSNLNDLSALVHWDTSNVTDMTLMFPNCSSLTDLTGLENWNVSKVTSMSSMFTSCSNLSNLSSLEDWNVSKVTNMNSMFSNCPNLTGLTPLASWDVSNVTNMAWMFSGCSNLTNLTSLVDWNVSKVTDMSYIFRSCTKLTDLSALASWNISNVTNIGMIAMFQSCSNLQEVGIPSLANGGQNLVSRASQSYLGTYLTTIITDDFTMGPYSWNQLKSEMQTNPDAFQDGTIWIKYTPSWMVTYNANGGVSSMPGSMTPVNQLLTLPESSFLRFGYKFTGWTTQPDPVSDTNTLMKPGQIFNPSDKTDGKKYTLYAQWEKIGDTGDLPSSSQSGMIPGWIQVDSNNTKADITPNQSQSVIFTNKYDPGSTSIQFKFTKLMDGNVPDSGESFQFELFSVSENKVIQTTTNTGASVQFQPITYNKAGVYTYYVRESASNSSNNVNDDPNLDYDNHLVEAVVTVTEEADPTSPSSKKLKATAQVTGDTTFRNDSKPASIDISKTVTGVTEGMSETHKDREFTFNVNLLDRDNQPVTGKTYPTTITNNSESGGNTSPSTNSITFDNSGNATVKLKAGGELTINGIPAYYKYTITETNIPVGYENISLTNPSGILGANSHVTVDAVNHYTVTPASASLQVGKILLAPGGLNQSVNNGEFRFTLCQVTPLTIRPESGPNAESCTGVSEASNDGNGLVTFPQLMYDAPGTYQYQIREVRGDALDMTYDSTVYTVTVKVTDDGEGRLVATITYRNNTTGVESSPVSSPVWDPSDPGSMGVPVFVNRTTVANRLPVTGGRGIIIAGVVLAMILAGGLFVFLRRNHEE